VPTFTRQCPLLGSDWIDEIEHDDFRILARRDGAGMRPITRECLCQTRPRSRISAYSALPPYTEAFKTSLIVPLLTNLLKLAAARITRQLAQHLLH
jgi:hypothetical protein